MSSVKYFLLDQLKERYKDKFDKDLFITYDYKKTRIIIDIEDSFEYIIKVYKYLGDYILKPNNIIYVTISLNDEDTTKHNVTFNSTINELNVGKLLGNYDIYSFNKNHIDDIVYKLEVLFDELVEFDKQNKINNDILITKAKYALKKFNIIKDEIDLFVDDINVKYPDDKFECVVESKKLKQGSCFNVFIKNIKNVEIHIKYFPFEDSFILAIDSYASSKLEVNVEFIKTNIKEPLYFIMKWYDVYNEVESYTEKLVKEKLGEIYA